MNYLNKSFRFLVNLFRFLQQSSFKVLGFSLLLGKQDKVQILTKDDTYIHRRQKIAPRNRQKGQKSKYQKIQFQAVTQKRSQLGSMRSSFFKVSSDILRKPTEKCCILQKISQSHFDFFKYNLRYFAKKLKKITGTLQPIPTASS